MQKRNFGESEVLVLIGFLLSSSVFLYLPLMPEVLYSFSKYTWTFLISFNLLVFLINFFIYLKTNFCSFVLEICEYFLLPISCFAMIQEIAYFTDQKQKQPEFGASEIISIFLFIATLFLACVKIKQVNQCFALSPGKNVLKFEDELRYWRVFKMLCACIAYLLFSENIYIIFLIVCTCVDLIITISQITFVHLELEETTVIANFSNIVSIAVYCYLDFNSNGISFLWCTSLQAILLILYFVFQKHFHHFFEAKYIFVLNEVKNGKIDFTNQKCQKLIVSIFSCLRSLYKFDHENDTLTLKEKENSKWSLNFISLLKMSYMTILIAYFEQLEIESHEKFAKIISESSNMRTTERLRREKKQKTFVNENLEAKMVLLFEKYFKIKKSITEIMENKNIFLQLISYCIDIFAENNPELSWKFTDEFFLTFLSQVNSKFYIRSISLCERREVFTKESLFYKQRNQKARHYLLKLRIFYEIHTSEAENLMVFENKLEKLKVKIIETCTEELEFYNDLSTKIENVFDIEKYLSKRKSNKTKVHELFNSCFKDQHYINFQEFTYLFLLFHTAFCKQLNKTEEIIYQHFKIPNQTIKSIQEQVNTEENKQICLKSIIVCCGIDIENASLGDIVMCNSTFREKFDVRKSSSEFKFNKINDLFYLEELREKHNQAMRKQLLFENEIQEEENKEHSEHNCYIKVNLERKEQNIVQNFKISTKVFYNFEMVLSYICVLEEKNEEKRYIKIENGRTDKKLNFKETDTIYVQQLGVEMCLVKINEKMTSDYCFSNENEVSSESVQNSCIGLTNEHSFNEKEIKNQKIEKAIENKNTILNFSEEIVSCLSLVFFILSIITSIILIQVEQERVKEAQGHSIEIETFLSGPQSCEAIIGEHLYLIEKIKSGQLNNEACFPYIMDLEQISRLQINQCIGDKIPNYLKKYFLNSFQMVPLFSSEIIHTVKNNNDVSDRNNGEDFSNLLSEMTSTGNFYLEKDLSQLQGEEKRSFQMIVKNFLNPFEKSVPKKFFEELIDRNQEDLLKTENEQTLSYSLGIVFVVILLILFMLTTIWAFYKIFLHYKLLSKVERSYFERASYGIKRIIRQIQKMKEFQTYECNFFTNYTVEIKTKTPTSTDEREYSLHQFEEMICEDESELPPLNEPAIKEISAARSILMGKKEVFFVLFCFCGICIGILTNVWFKNKGILSNHFILNEIFSEVSTTRIALSEIETATWMMFLKENEIKSKEEIMESFSSSLEILKNQSLYVLLNNLENTNLLKKTLYLNICETIGNTIAPTFEECQKMIGEYSSLTISELLSISTDQFSTFIEKINNQNDIPLQTSMCSVFLINFYLTIPGLIKMWQTLIEIIDIELEQSIKEIENLFYMLVIISTLACFFTVGINLMKGNQLKHEVLKIGTIEKLYENQSFQPFLNKLYNESVI